MPDSRIFKSGNPAGIRQIQIRPDYPAGTGFTRLFPKKCDAKIVAKIFFRKKNCGKFFLEKKFSKKNSEKKRLHKIIYPQNMNNKICMHMHVKTLFLFNGLAGASE